MTLHVRTARVSYRGPDRLDITRKSGDSFGKTWAPSWELLRPALHARQLTVAFVGRGMHETAVAIAEDMWTLYRVAFLSEMRASYRLNRWAWDELLGRESVTLCCYCTDERCHRRIVAELLALLGAVDDGEVPDRQMSLAERTG